MTVNYYTSLFKQKNVFSRTKTNEILLKTELLVHILLCIFLDIDAAVCALIFGGLNLKIREN